MPTAKNLLTSIRKIRHYPDFLVHKIIYDIFKKKMGNRIVSGPFLGMKYREAQIKEPHFPSLLGTHELELQPLIEQLCKKPFTDIINAGADEGYYAIGLAIRNPRARIIAFEANPERRTLIKRMAQINNVIDRVNIYGLCDVRSLSDSLSKCNKCLIVMDIEGGECILLDSFIVPKLKECHILVELHVCFFSEIGEIIYERFKDSHRITEILQKSRRVEDFRIKLSGMAQFIPKKFLIVNMWENRDPADKWFYLEPNI